MQVAYRIPGAPNAEWAVIQALLNDNSGCVAVIHPCWSQRVQVDIYNRLYRERPSGKFCAAVGTSGRFADCVEQEGLSP